MSFGSKILKYREEMLRDLARLVAIPSVRSEAREGMPFGENSARALQTILAMADEMGLKTKNVANYAGHAEYGEGRETLRCWHMLMWCRPVRAGKQTPML